MLVRLDHVAGIRDNGQRVGLRYTTVNKFDTAKPTHTGLSQANWLASVLLAFHGKTRKVKGIGNVVKGKLLMLSRRFVLFARNSGRKFGKVVKEKLIMVFRRFVLLARNVGRNRENDNKDKRRPLRLVFAWPHVVNSSVAMQEPLAAGTWIWHRQHARWHHGYYRTRR